jgi:hypothetical protein
MSELLMVVSQKRTKNHNNQIEIARRFPTGLCGAHSVNR